MKTFLRTTMQRKRVSLPPGTPVYVGHPAEGPARLRAAIYDQASVEKRVVTVDTLPQVSPGAVTWLQVEGVHDVETVQRIGEAYALHMLAVEDIVNTDHRAKMEEYDDAVFLIARHFRQEEDGELQAENVAMVLKRNVVLSFSEERQAVFDPNQERLEAANGKFRARGADYLFYTLLDSVVDHYVAIIETFDDRIQELEDAVLFQPSRETVQALHALRRSLLQLRRAALPLRECVVQLLRNEENLISRDVQIFLRDVQDHIAMVLDNLEHDREVLAGLLDLYMTNESNRMNEVMKVLTVIATLFIPLTFIAGVYGMNFHFMPELSQPWGYPAVLALMLVVAAALLLFFRRRGWF